MKTARLILIPVWIENAHNKLTQLALCYLWVPDVFFFLIILTGLSNEHAWFISRTDLWELGWHPVDGQSWLFDANVVRLRLIPVHPFESLSFFLSD